MTLSGDAIDLVAVLVLIFTYTLAGILLAGGQQVLGSWLALIGGIIAGLIEIVGILRRI